MADPHERMMALSAFFFRNGMSRSSDGPLPTTNTGNPTGLAEGRR